MWLCDKPNPLHSWPYYFLFLHPINLSNIFHDSWPNELRDSLLERHKVKLWKDKYLNWKLKSSSIDMQTVRLIQCVLVISRPWNSNGKGGKILVHLHTNGYWKALYHLLKKCFKYQTDYTQVICTKTATLFVAAIFPSWKMVWKWILIVPAPVLSLVLINEKLKKKTMQSLKGHTQFKVWLIFDFFNKIGVNGLELTAIQNVIVYLNHHYIQQIHEEVCLTLSQCLCMHYGSVVIAGGHSLNTQEK